MKKAFVMLAFLFICVANIKAQDLTLNELIDLNSKSISDISVYLTGEQWVLASTRDTNNVMDVRWGYKLNKGKAIAWLYASKGLKANTITYTFFSTDVFSEIVKSIHKHKMEPRPEKIIKNGISTVYVGDKYVVRMYVQHQDTKNVAFETLYRAVLIPKEDWEDDTPAK